MSDQKQYLCIDLKSFYASVECVARGLDPMTTDLVVADPERTEKTICLAVSPSMKAKGVKNRCRVFQIPKDMDYIMAPPRMQLYIERSAEIYGILLRHFAKEDIHVYSIDESFIDITHYLPLYGLTPRELGEKVRSEIAQETGIPATCGLGPNLFLAKVALDITAKHSPDFFGVLDEDSFKETLWNHKPLTDFWRIGHGTANKLAELGIETLAQLALYPHKEDLFKVLGIDAEILIDHAWGIEPVTIADIKAYRRQTHSIVNAQVLASGYTFDNARTVVKEMLDNTCLDMVSKGVVAQSLTLNVRYEKDEDGVIYDSCGTVRPPDPTNSRAELLEPLMELFDRTVSHDMLVRNLALSCNNVTAEESGQLNMFVDEEARAVERERQESILQIKQKFGKNAILRGTDLLPEATQRERNQQIGGHKSNG